MKIVTTLASRRIWYRRDMMKWSEEIRNKDYGYFCRGVEVARKHGSECGLEVTHSEVTGSTQVRR